MSRPLHTWLVFALLCAPLLGALGWISFKVFELDDQSARARSQATLEENVRLALWRMDSAVSPLIGQENARPAHAYLAFHPAQRAYTRLLSELDPGEVMVPSPLLGQTHPHVKLHFQLAETRGKASLPAELSSPQVPTGNKRDLAESGYASHELIQSAARELARLASLIDVPVLIATLGEPAEPADRVAMAPGPQGEQGLLANTRRSAPAAQQALSANEWQARSRAVWTYNNPAMNTPGLRQQAEPAAPQAPRRDLSEASHIMKPLWLGEELLLVRRVQLAGRRYIQGCWLDWPALSASLLAEVGDLLPQASLVPQKPTERGRELRSLAALPIRLLPGPALTASDDAGLSPIQISLLLAWFFVLVAVLAVALLLRGTLALSERRAAFVSAVTHELRTPLTTFRMYTEMLAEGMVEDPARQQQYFETLHAEAERLDHLVHNVLAYSRLERGRFGARRESVELGALIDKLAPRLDARARQAEMSLQVEIDDSARARELVTDAEGIERILFNLVDNACKYASATDDRSIRLQARRTCEGAEIAICDAGPGIENGLRRKLFAPFSKSAEEAAGGAPGVGLGLALSSKLARRLGGALRLESPPAGGACFVLGLPVKPGDD
ncbi:MAG: HAMP domain-containing histidine kinase [Deltaproteobacteria bacterium]|nr:HAMP domain-containing histidine kinase [Deltaproteobacteria bacterium]